MLFFVDVIFSDDKLPENKYLMMPNAGSVF